jgi:TfoX/Sxy family transcriptional regulator of competence genes
MPTNRDFIEYVAEQAQLGDALTFRKLFGEYGVYLGGKVIAFACDNSLFVKTTPATAEITRSLPQRPPYPGTSPYPVADELLDDTDALKSLLVKTAEDLPAPRIKRPRVKPKGRPTKRMGPDRT